MTEYKILKRQHADFDAVAIKKELLLYQGGQEIKRCAHLFLQQLHQESSDSYDERIATASYVPLLGKFIDYFVSSLFSKDIQVVPQDRNESYDKEFYKEFAADCTGFGDSFQSFITEVFRTALIHTTAFIGVDFPRSKAEAKNLLQQKELGLLRAYLYSIDNATIVDWLIDPVSGELCWLKLQEDLPFQPTPLEPEPMHFLRWKCWTLEGEGDNRRAKWEIYETKPLKIGEFPKESEDIPTIDEGITSFNKIPVLCLTLPDGLAIGAKVSPLAEEHFNRRSIEHRYTNLACVPIPYIKKGPGLAADGSINTVSLNRFRGNDPVGKVNSKNYVEIASTDEVGIAETEGKALGFIHQQNKDLEEVMHSIVNQLSIHGRSQTTKMSAESKVEDRHATEIQLTDYAELVEEFCVCIYDLIAKSREEGVGWTVRGLNTATYVDRAQLIDEATKMTKVGIQAPIFLEKYQYQTAVAIVPNFSEEEEHKLLDQISTTATQPAVDENTQQKQSLTKQTSDKAEEPVIGEEGHAELSEDAHLSDGEHTHWSEVYDLIKDDYPEEELQWLSMIPWRGPVAVKSSSVDTSDKDEWRATKPGADGLDKVAKFKEKMADQGQWKPIILVNEPHSDRKMWLVDGRHRYTAANELGIDPIAYIGEVGSIRDDSPWVKLHSKQTSYQNSAIKEDDPTKGLKLKAGDENPNQIYKSKKVNNAADGDFKV